MPYTINRDYVSKNIDDRVQYIVLHYTEVDFEDALKIMTEPDPQVPKKPPSPVSAHYLLPVQEKHVVYQLVSEDKRARHAGVSYWHGRNDLNDTSIGIEIVNLGYTEVDDKRQWYKYPTSQINTLIELVRDIINRHGIAPTAVVGHSDIATPLGRKVDPGPLFPWKMLYEHGIGAWYDAPEKTKAEAFFKKNLKIDKKPIEWVQNNLKIYGYYIPSITGTLDDPTQKALTAFQMHFRPEDFSGKPDPETLAILYTLNRKYYPSETSIISKSDFIAPQSGHIQFS